jgi:uncharacterized protein (TIGR03546 family)
MLAILKLVQSLFKTLHSDGSPSQVAVGMALGVALGFIPLMNLSTVLIFVLLFLLNVSFGAGMLGWALSVPVGFALDPVFDRVGRWLLIDSPGLTPFWTRLANAPVVPLTNFNNTVVLGSLVTWLVLFVPLVLLFRWGVVRYRATIGQKVMGSRLYKAIVGSQVYNLYRLFRPE